MGLFRNVEIIPYYESYVLRSFSYFPETVVFVVVSHDPLSITGFMACILLISMICLCCYVCSIKPRRLRDCFEATLMN